MASVSMTGLAVAGIDRFPPRGIGGIVLGIGCQGDRGEEGPQSHDKAAPSCVTRLSDPTVLQHVQKRRPARPERAKGRGGTYQASLDPLASITCERIGTVPSPSVRGGSERCENAAGGLFQHAVNFFSLCGR